MVQIWADARDVAPGAKVVGHYVGVEAPTGLAGHTVPNGGAVLTRVYQGYGWLRAETGTPPRRGFGELIAFAELKVPSGNLKLWLKVED